MGVAREAASRGERRFEEVARTAGETGRDAIVEGVRGTPAGAGPVWLPRGGPLPRSRGGGARRIRLRSAGWGQCDLELVRARLALPARGLDLPPRGAVLPHRQR